MEEQPMKNQALLDRPEQDTVPSPRPRTKAEIAAWLYTSGDGSDLTQCKQTIPSYSPTIITTAFIGNAAFTASAVTASAVTASLLATLLAIGHHPPTPPPTEDLISQEAEQVRELGPTASVSQLLAVRQRLLTGK